MALVNPPPQPPYARLAAVLFLSVITGFSLGVFFYRRWVYDQRTLSDAAFTASHPEPAAAPQPQTITAESQPAPSSLNMIETGPMGPAMAGRPNPRPEQSVASLVNKNESRYEALARQYTQKYPVIEQYGRDWASYPDLRRFNLEYLHDRDPIKFSYHVASSPNF